MSPVTWSPQQSDYWYVVSACSFVISNIVNSSLYLSVCYCYYELQEDSHHATWCVFTGCSECACCMQCSDAVMESLAWPQCLNQVCLWDICDSSFVQQNYLSNSFSNAWWMFCQLYAEMDLASCSFDRHGLVLIFAISHQHTFNEKSAQRDANSVRWL